jgi:hypothetical protein
MVLSDKKSRNSSTDAQTKLGNSVRNQNDLRKKKEEMKSKSQTPLSAASVAAWQG